MENVTGTFLLLVYFNQNILLCSFSHFLPSGGGGGGTYPGTITISIACVERSEEVKTRRCFYHHTVRDIMWRLWLVTACSSDHQHFTQIEIEWDLTPQQ